MTDIVLIEDDARLATFVATYLQTHGYKVVIESDGGRAEAVILQEQPRLVLLDIALPNRNGFDICRDIRASYGGVILMLTARNEEIDQVLGLELGADDYVAKPIPPRVLLARIRAHLRRDSLEQDATSLRFGCFAIDQRIREATLSDERIDLTDAEFDLLWLLASHAGYILSRDELSQNLRGIRFDGLDRSIDARISRLRRKVKDTDGEPERIKTVRGRGYLFNASGWNA